LDHPFYTFSWGRLAADERCASRAQITADLNEMFQICGHQRPKASVHQRLIAGAPSTQTRMLLSFAGPNCVASATSAASRP
jgi:hypothetical protein